MTEKNVQNCCLQQKYELLKCETIEHILRHFGNRRKQVTQQFSAILLVSSRILFSAGHFFHAQNSTRRVSADVVCVDVVSKQRKSSTSSVWSNNDVQRLFNIYIWVKLSIVPENSHRIECWMTQRIFFSKDWEIFVSSLHSSSILVLPSREDLKFLRFFRFFSVLQQDRLESTGVDEAECWWDPHNNPNITSH